MELWKIQSQLTVSFILIIGVDIDSSRGKFEIRITKLETNSNDQNTNNQNSPMDAGAVVLNFGHSGFDIVSDFGFISCVSGIAPF
ncbi:hypothetical protein JY97_09125 [Alkalispirochaeta odontotermitis]|nr:hypothetical protein JY97_09125 [Alkalispirochaeta odontotermitis]